MSCDRSITFAIIAVCVLGVPLPASAVVINGDEPRQQITVVPENSTVDRILQDLSARYGFEIKGIQNVGAGDTLSPTLSGSLYKVLGRLLRNRNYVIVRSPDNACGIAKVIILDANYGTAPTKIVPVQTEESEAGVGS
jgi:hypothetical protein